MSERARSPLLRLPGIGARSWKGVKTRCVASIHVNWKIAHQHLGFALCSPLGERNLICLNLRRPDCRIVAVRRAGALLSAILLSAGTLIPCLLALRCAVSPPHACCSTNQVGATQETVAAR